MNKICVSDIIAKIHRFAPPALAYDWDNVGFMLGDANQEVNRILLSLDVTENTLQYALQKNIQLIITHHPLIFKPINKITNHIHLKLIQNNIAVISAHTNLDVTAGGVNHKLAEIFELQNLSFLSPRTGSSQFHITAYVPQSALNKVKKAVFNAGAGIIGNYSQCMNYYSVQGQFLPLEKSNPTIGSINKLEQVEEVKIEFFVDSFNLQNVLKALKKAHPYETPAYAVYPQNKNSENYGLGLIGTLPEAVSIAQFAKTVKNKLAAPVLKVWLANKNKDTKLKKIALCGGSGASLIASASGLADLFLAGEFDYHSILDSKIPLIEAGHFHTEYPVLQVLADLLSDDDLQIFSLPPQNHEISSSMLYL